MSSMFTIKNAKANFFSTKKVKTRVNYARRRVLSKAGAFVRTTARGYIRKSKNISTPGKPPKSHAGQLKSLLFFAHDASTDGVVVGPAKFGKGKAPNLLEFGGVVRGASEFKVSEDGGRDSAGKFKKRKTRTVQSKFRRYRARPFMRPALIKNLPKLPKLWSNSVKGA